jgi:YesN/AraC family two-component response regulator
LHKTYIKLQKFLKLSSRRCAEVVSSKVADFDARQARGGWLWASQSLALSVQEVGAANQSHLSAILHYDMGITPVCDYIEAHLDDRLTQAEVARVACFSPYHFSRSFKQAVGVGPHCYVIQRRLERVKT